MHHLYVRLEKESLKVFYLMTQIDISIILSFYLLNMELIK